MSLPDLPRRAGLIVFACVADGVAAALLAAAGSALILQAANGLPATADRGDFATGMLLSGIGWGAVALAALFGMHAGWCAWRLRRAGAKNPPAWGETVMILSAPVIATAVVIATVLHLLG